MANWDQQQQQDEDRANYRDRVKNAAVNINNQAQAFQNNFDAIRAGASAENQVVMDAVHAQLVAVLKTTLGIV